MALDDILRAIRADTDDTIRDLDAECAADVAAIASRADAEARLVEQEMASSRDASAAREAARIVDRARLEARRAELAAIESAYQETLAELRARLAALRHTTDYRDIVARLLEEGFEVLPDPTTVHVDPDDVELVGSLLAQCGRSDVAVSATSRCAGGVVLVADGGRVVRNTFESRLQRADGRLRALVAAHLPDGALT